MGAQLKVHSHGEMSQVRWLQVWSGEYSECGAPAHQWLGYMAMLTLYEHLVPGNGLSVTQCPSASAHKRQRSQRIHSQCAETLAWLLVLIYVCETIAACHRRVHYSRGGIHVFVPAACQ